MKAEKPLLYKMMKKKYDLKSKYGMTLGQFFMMLAEQKYKCAICKKPFPIRSSIKVDHDHSTGMVRGLLCNSCNNGLGRFKDNPATLLRAAKYLMKIRV